MIVINHIRDVRKDLTNARELLGQLLHTLQDFYSHSNWVEMGKTDINELIGFTENIGTIAKQDQSTCTSNGCTRIEKSCVILFSFNHSITYFLFRHFGNKSLWVSVHLSIMIVKIIFYQKLMINRYLLVVIQELILVKIIKY